MSNQEGKQKSNDQGSGKAGGDSKPVEIIIVPPRLVKENFERDKNNSKKK